MFVVILILQPWLTDIVECYLLYIDIEICFSIILELGLWKWAVLVIYYIF